MKLRNWLPTKYLTEENPVIGLSFEVGWARMAVMVGQTVIHTMSNMIRGDYDSEVYNCIPVWMYERRLMASGFTDKHHPMGGGFRRQDNGMMEIHSALTPSYRSALPYTGVLLEFRRNQKATHPHPDIVEMDRMHRFLNSPYLYQSIGSMGHMDHDLSNPNYLTSFLYEKTIRRAAVDAGFGELTYMQRKLLNNSQNGISRKESGHSSLTAACLAKPKYRLTDMHGGRGVAVPVYPGVKDIIQQFVGHKASLRLGEKYYFTGVGMLPKDL